MPWRVYRPAIVVGHSRDRRDGQGRRPLLLLPAAQDAARRAARLAAAGRRRPRRHQRRAGRLRRRRDGPPRPPRPTATARRSTWSTPSRSRWWTCINAFCAAAGAPAVRDPDRPPRHRRGTARPGPARAAPLRGPGGRWSAPRPGQVLLDQTLGRARHPGRGARPHVASARSSTPGVPRRRWPAPASRCPTSSPTPARCGATGRTTSTSPPAATRATRAALHGQVRRHHRRLVGHRPGHRAQGRPGRRHPGAGRPRQGQARGDPGDDRDCAAARPTSTPATSPTSRRSTGSASSWPPTCPRSTSSSTTPAARSAARCGSRRTASTTSSAPCSSTTSARSGW